MFAFIFYFDKVVDGCSPEELDPKKKLDSLMHLAELCIEVIQQNEEYHAEVDSLVFFVLFFVIILQQDTNTAVI